MRTNLSKFVVLVLVASAILALAGCGAFDSVAPKTQQETVPERAFDLNISVTTVGPVKYIDTLSAPEGSDIDLVCSRTYSSSETRRQ